MLALDLKKKQLIDKIKHIENKDLLDEAIRLLDLESEDIEIFKLNNEQKDAIDQARQQIKLGRYLTNEQANREIEEWLKK